MKLCKSANKQTNKRPQNSRKNIYSFAQNKIFMKIGKF